jgi:hypothetical protein
MLMLAISFNQFLLQALEAPFPLAGNSVVALGIVLGVLAAKLRP